MPKITIKVQLLVEDEEDLKLLDIYSPSALLDKAINKELPFIVNDIIVESNQNKLLYENKTS